MEYPGTVITPGAGGEGSPLFSAIQAIQRQLSVQATGVYGPTTQGAVTGFQTAHSIAPTGEVGPQTWAALFAPPDALPLALKFTLQYEGGWSDNPHDPGGATMRGITQATYDHYRDGRGEDRRSVQLLEEGELQDIYRSMYWQPAGCAGLPAPLAVVYFDTAVNCGVGGLHRLVRRVDPTLPFTARAVSLCGVRRSYRDELIARNPALAVFRKGWLARDNALQDYAAGLA